MLVERATKYELARERRRSGLLRRDEAERNGRAVGDIIGNSFEALRRNLPEIAADSLTESEADRRLEARVRLELERISGDVTATGKRLYPGDGGSDYDAGDEAPQT